MKTDNERSGPIDKSTSVKDTAQVSAFIIKAGSPYKIGINMVQNPDGNGYWSSRKAVDIPVAWGLSMS